ncbi:hypothetical protein K402DRAFT_336213 [Aulographum hederae CBS 113979]|uniref:R3H domain-containing protein n=1 Tax=Aulographum hederae CBS 113979 TaxID=1176131 RepID=A0A6G1GUI0_9PEZI|nr:hypothetical protein K402DRAFT_336213 [Aulographum hederae CBS 113979]
MADTLASQPPPPQPSSEQQRRPRRRRPAQRDQQSQAQTDALPQEQHQSSRRGGHRGSGGGGRGGAPRAPPFPPAIDSTTDISNGNAIAQNDTSARRGGRGRGGARSQNPQNHRQTINTSRTFDGRQFGGQLSQPAPSDTSSIASGPSNRLQADAPAFQPGQPIIPRAQPPRAPRGQAQQPRKRRMSKSSAPDLPTRVHEDIDCGNYECVICTNEIMRNSKAWSCRTCWTVMHFSCIKKWSLNEGSAMARQQASDGEMPPPRQWRCPGCNLPKDAIPSSPTCWCEKETDIRSTSGLPPFSCGQTCSRAHVLPKSCPHPCPDICHAGPCPPCQQMGPSQSCFCGQQSVSRRCVDTDYEKGWSCGEVCGEMMPCGEHFCDRPCHEGLCGACEVVLNEKCYCGQVEKELLCCDKQDEVISRKRLQPDEDGSPRTEEWTGSFECGNTCERDFDCGKHQCQKPCHTQDEETPHCPRSPDVVSHCPCGKTPLLEITNKPRTSCEDSIPNCKQPCLKALSCGHPCQQICHSGECRPCLATVPIACRCGRTTSSTLCHQGSEEHPQCMRTCRATLNCGRHVCDERCCTGEKKAAERRATKRKPRALDSAPQRVENDVEAEHICTRVCGRPLKCGTHVCEELCHRGPCGSCREAIFDELSCHCGRTVLQPPLPCGTQPPPCRFKCERPKACGHPQVDHNCHLDNESCPKCPFLTTKPCLCGKNQLKNQPCWLTEARCGELCNRTLKCGAHRCRKQCHRPGECEDQGGRCPQVCGKTKKLCGHPCSDLCHSPSACKEDQPCQYKTFITCECQRIKQETRCNASKHSAGNTEKTLKCDDECARLERNRKLALAFDIDPENHKNDHVPYSAETLDMYASHGVWASAQEKELRNFAADADQRRLRFKPMKRPQRKFLHSLADDFGFDSESMDPEPHRHVAIFKTPRFVMAPMKTLAECARIRNVQRSMAAASAPAAAPAEKKRSNLVEDPYNAFLVTNARFGLTLEELRAAVRPVLGESGKDLDISFLLSEEVVMRYTTSTASSNDRDLEANLQAQKPALLKAVASYAFGTLQLCRVDSSLNVLRRESDEASSGGWSQVAARAASSAMRRPQPTPVGVKSSFTVLSTAGSKKGKKHKAAEENVVDDWEQAELMEEEREKAEASGSAIGSGGEEGVGSGEI